MEPTGRNVGDMLRVALDQPDSRVDYPILLSSLELISEYLGYDLAMGTFRRYDEFDHRPLAAHTLV
jgi:hypothetical protein